MEQTLLNTLAAGEVTRYHATPGVDSQTVSQHSWGVTMIYTELCRTISQTVCGMGLLHSLTHDNVELFTGDIPFTMKRDNPEIRTMLSVIESTYACKLIEAEVPRSARVKMLLKLADYVEGMWWCASHEHGSVKPIQANYVEGLHRNWATAQQECLFNSNEERWLTEFLRKAILEMSGAEADFATGEPTSAYVNQ